jgi:hypothetical protein
MFVAKARGSNFSDCKTNTFIPPCCQLLEHTFTGIDLTTSQEFIKISRIHTNKGHGSAYMYMQGGNNS